VYKKSSTPKTGLNPEILFCRKSHRFENIIVCTINCFDRCGGYYDKFSIEILKNYVQNHPEYELKGVIMPKAKTVTVETKSTPKEKLYWIITEENNFVEVTETEIKNDPVNYIGKPMFEKPKDEYEIIVTIKKKIV
jgi:hypothetical protein